MTFMVVPLLAVFLLLPASDGRGQHQDLPVSSPGDGSSLQFPPYYEAAGRGRHWYQPIPPPPEEETPDAPPDVPPLPVPAPLTPREILKRQGEAWQDALARAVLHPSPKHYLEYLRMTSAIQDQAQRFALGFKHMIWRTPEFDYTLTAPVQAEAIAAKNQRALFQETADLAALADRYGLVFFLRSDCPYCHRFAPILKTFAGTHGFSVLPVSLDGKGLPEFPFPKPNALLAQKLEVDVVPTVFLVDPVRNQLLPVSYGFTDASTLAKKILWAAQSLQTDKNDVAVFAAREGDARNAGPGALLSLISPVTNTDQGDIR